MLLRSPLVLGKHVTQNVRLFTHGCCFAPVPWHDDNIPLVLAPWLMVYILCSFSLQRRHPNGTTPVSTTLDLDTLHTDLGDYAQRCLVHCICWWHVSIHAADKGEQTQFWYMNSDRHPYQHILLCLSPWIWCQTVLHTSLATRSWGSLGQQMVPTTLSYTTACYSPVLPMAIAPLSLACLSITIMRQWILSLKACTGFLSRHVLQSVTIDHANIQT